ncbi:MAG TPA: DUF4395 domain-containing protein [Holophagaceae bacterium]
MGPAQVDGGSARIGACLVLGLAVLVAWKHQGGLALALAGDFLLRAQGWMAWSPVARAASGLRRAMRLPFRPVNAGPKRFAAWLGAGMTLAVALAFLSGHLELGRGLSAGLGVCAGLEGLFGVCVACWIHARLPRPKPRPAPEAIGLS